VFAQFGSDLDRATRDKLLQGERLVETLKQSLHKTLPVEDQVIVLFCATNRYLMDLPTKKVREFNKELLKYIKENHAQIPEAIRITGNMDEEVEKLLRIAIESFKSQYRIEKSI
jgi:F-type H+-transporting ATPase subunit alpha